MVRSDSTAIIILILYLYVPMFMGRWVILITTSGSSLGVVIADLCISHKPTSCGSLIPRPSASSALLTFELACNQKSGRGAGEFYHMSDIKGREKVERT